ncbi:MAG: hypothetical protein KGJ79_06185 [Alphaproteobacteria bacterium]|nr:hypothetical protein [Alphaproteobacteria bacterium]MDE2110711.1 hypothetical protein [Alphaproteobacteria bacterium]MDE2494516.1 hypothetical protein [Alphaproteobacteria bacterium]
MVLFAVAIVLIVVLDAYFRQLTRTARSKMLAKLANMEQRPSPEQLADIVGRPKAQIRYGLLLLCAGMVLATVVLQRDRAIAALDRTGAMAQTVMDKAAVANVVHLAQLECNHLLTAVHHVVRVN